MPEAKEKLILTALKWINDLSGVTLNVSVLLICCSIVQMVALQSWEYIGQMVCLEPTLVAWHFELWRMFTAHLFHTGAAHLIINLVVFAPVGDRLERSMGTGRFFLLLLCFVVLQDLVQIFAAYLLAAIGQCGALKPCTAGFSGVTIALLVADNAAGNAARWENKHAGVPATLLPWLLVAVLMLCTPAPYWLSHMAGMLVGEAWVAGLLAPLQPENTQQGETAGGEGAPAKGVEGGVEAATAAAPVGTTADAACGSYDSSGSSS